MGDVIAGTFADFKLIKTRGVVQIVVEIPEEMGERALQLLGFPRSGQDIPVAVARLVETPAEKPASAPADKPRRRFEDMPRSQQAGVLCADQRFQEWLGASNVDQAAIRVRRRCCVDTRAKLDTMKGAGREWDRMVNAYRAATGQQAEARG